MPGNFYTPTFEDITHWPQANYMNPPEQRSWLGGFAVAWQCVSTILVLGRLYLRINNRSGPFGFDDAFIFIAWIFSIMLTTTACISDWNFRMGRHIWNFEPLHFSASMKVGWFAQIFFLLTMLFTKSSVLLCYRRMAKATYSKNWVCIIWVLLFITVGSSVGMLFAYCFMCQPLRYYWDYLWMDAAHEVHYCINGDSVTIATGTLTIASDFWTAALPCAMLYHHDMGATRRQKILLNCLFCVGFLVTGVGIARTYYLWKVGHNQDLTWIGYDLYTSSVAEIQLAIVCVCAPFVRSFLREYFPALVISNRTDPGRGTVSQRPSNTSTAIGSLTTDDKGMVIREQSLSSPIEDMFSLEERGELEWARRQVQQSNYKPQGPGAEISVAPPEEVHNKEPSVKEGRRQSASRVSVLGEREQEWARSKVQEWVTKRPTKEGDEEPILPNMSPTLAGNWG